MEKQTKQVQQKTNLRPPVVTIMGHVDHGKTTLLDYIRKSKIAEKEHGGITQHIGAYQIDMNGKKITFIDTPGHAAFGAMRARGAKVTDIVILVVAADDGVMPQTKESISHIKAAGVPMIVAINKMDLPGANVDRVKKSLAENGVLVEGYGGQIVTVPISAKTGSGVNDLLEMVNLVAEIAELKEESNVPFEGVVIESSLDRFRGPLASVLVKKGKLNVGDIVSTETSSGKVKALIDSSGKQVKEALVSTPVEVLGFEQVPKVGEVVSFGPKQAPNQEQKVEKAGFEKFAQTQDISVINLIIKADVAGSLEAIANSLENLATKEQKINIISKETGEINESDVLLAASTKAIVIGFNVKISKTAEKLAEEEKVMIRTFNIIYELLDELQEGLEALVNAKRETILGKGKILEVFDTSAGKVAGTQVLEGRFTKGDKLKILRDDQEVGTTRLKSVRHLKEEITTAREGDNYGLLLDGKVEFAKNDIIVAIS